YRLIAVNYPWGGHPYQRRGRNERDPLFVSGRDDRPTPGWGRPTFSNRSGAAGRRNRYGEADGDQVPFRILEPCNLRPADLCDAIDGLELRAVVLLEFEAACPEVLDGGLHVWYLEGQLRVRPRRLSAAQEDRKTGAARQLEHHPSAGILI